MEEIAGYIERIIFQNEENGFTVAHLKEAEDEKQVCVVGNLYSVQRGETVRCQGNWIVDPKHGKQFQIETFLPQTPTTIIGIQKYLGAGHIQGIGPTYAKRIVKKFGLDTLNIIDEHPDRLLEIPGLGKKRLKRVKKCWKEQQSMRNALIFLQSHGISSNYAQKIFNVYGEECFDKVTKNPYQLTRDIFGIGFKKADEIAKNIGISSTSEKRIDAGIEYVLTELSDNGHVCYPIKDFLIAASNTLGIYDIALIKSRLEFLLKQNVIVIDKILENDKFTDFIWLKHLSRSEAGIASEITRLQNSPSYLREIDTKKAIEWAEDKLNIHFAESQKRAIASALQSKMQVVTGGPGTGKSTITRAIIAITEKISSKILLAAPTGRAAKRLYEITGSKAQTIHSMLEADVASGSFTRNAGDPLKCDLLIIDEASMIDTSLMYHLLQAIPSTARVIFIGDINQLPSVGPGNVLKNIIQSEIMPVTTLNQIFRQGEFSKITTNAHKINDGVFPDVQHEKNSDFFFIESPEPEKLVETLTDLVASRLPEKYGLHPSQDIQVLTPMKKGILGTGNLNETLKQKLNPSQHVLNKGGKQFSVGDKVMQIKNNYQKKVFNGDVGYITMIDEEESALSVSFEGRRIYYEFSELDEIVLAYAVSVHKYQGSECPCIVMPVHTTHFVMLQRNLLYTAVTRGKQLVVLLGTKKALSIAVRNDKIRTRHSGLLQALTSKINSLP